MLLQDDVTDYVKGLRAYADWLEKKAAVLPMDYIPSVSPMVSLTVSEWKKVDEETGEYGTVVDEEATKHDIKAMVKAMGSCKKEYIGSSLYLTKEFSDRVSIQATVMREITCKKVLTGEIVHHDELVVAAYDEEKFVWDCSDVPALLELVK